MEARLPTVGSLTESVANAVRSGLIPPRVMVACSGGADSVALAATVAGCASVTSAIGHVDHGLRPESSGEAEQVRALADKLAVPFFMERLEGLQIRADGLEAAARHGRYAALARLAQQAGATAVATA